MSHELPKRMNLDPGERIVVEVSQMISQRSAIMSKGVAENEMFTQLAREAGVAAMKFLLANHQTPLTFQLHCTKTPQPRKENDDVVVHVHNWRLDIFKPEQK